MIAVDTSTWIAFFSGEDGGDVDALDEALGAKQVVLPPVVLTELLSDPKLSPEVARLLHDLPILEIRPGFWERAGATRARLLARRLRARLADSLISQSCIDHRATLLTRDSDFRHFAKHCRLRLL